MRQVLRHAMAATAAIAVVVLMALASASPAVADGGEWDKDFGCKLELASLCLDLSLIGENRN